MGIVREALSEEATSRQTCVSVGAFQVESPWKTVVQADGITDTRVQSGKQLGMFKGEEGGR